MKKRILSLVLVLLMAFTVLSGGALAAEPEDFSPYEGLLRQKLYETWGQGYGTFFDFDGDGRSELVLVHPSQDNREPQVEVFRAMPLGGGQYSCETLLSEYYRGITGGQSEYQATIVETNNGEVGLVMEVTGTNTVDSPEEYQGLVDDYSFCTLYLYRDGRFVQAETAEAVIWHTEPDQSGTAYYYPDLGWIRINGADVSLEEYADWFDTFAHSLFVYDVLSPYEALGGLNGDELLSLSVTGFYDALYTAYYAEPVKWAADNGITKGTSDYTFSPDDPCTRAQVVTFLWRAAGCPEPKRLINPFRDVCDAGYYFKAVLWAVEQGITKGTGVDCFSPDDPCTRAQVVTFLYRNAKSPPVIARNPFLDVTTDQYYHQAVLWAVKNGITNGTSDTLFSPDMICSRAQIVTFLYRDLA